MTASIPLPDAPAAQTPSCIRLERLEYGKLCVDRFGAIEPNAEHGELGRTTNFSAEVAVHCDPAVIGAGGDEVEGPGKTHATVLRPVHFGTSTIAVMARVRSRPEDGEEGKARRYTIARYLISPALQIDPLRLFEAMDRDPLAALTRADADALSPVMLAVDGPEGPEEMDGFIRDAVIYAMSGSAITITERIPERQFFTYVSAIWRRLPPSLRSIVSAGWNVSPSLSGVLLLTNTGQVAPNSAAWTPSSRTWSPPQQIELAQQGKPKKTRPFSDARLASGRMYAFHFLGDAGSESVSRLMAHVPSEVELPELPDLRDAATVRMLRWPGLRMLDERRYARLHQWLRDGVPVHDLEQEAAAGAFIYDELQTSMLTALFEAFASPDVSRRRAESYLMAMAPRLENRWLHDPILRATRRGAARARVILRLMISSPAAETLADYASAAADGEVDDLPQEAASRLEAVLSSHLSQVDALTAELHARILTAPIIPVEYRQWAVREAARLELALARWTPPRARDAIRTVAARSGSAEIAALARWALEELPGESDVTAIQQLGESQRGELAAAMAARWMYSTTNVAARRETILSWVAAERPAPLSDPLLRLALAAELTVDDMPAIAAEVENERWPPSLEQALAELALRRWPSLSASIRSHGARWSRIIDWWPDDVRLLLLGIDTPGHPPTPAIDDAADALDLTTDEVSAILDRWIQRPRSAAAPDRYAVRIWRMASNARATLVNELRAVEMIQALAARQMPRGTPADGEQVTRTLRLARASGNDVALQDAVGVLWPLALTAWQIELVLRLFPQAELQPTTGQLETLFRNRQILLTHLAEQGLHPRRAAVFRVALLEFHAASYEMDGGGDWRAEYASSFLWGAFRGVPLAEQGSLRAALAAYAPGVRERIRAGQAYLDASMRGEDADDVRYRLLRDCILPLLTEHMPRQRAVGVLFELRRRAHPPASFLGRLSGWPRRAVHWIRRGVRVRVTDDGGHPVVVVGRTVLISDSLNRLIGAIDPDAAIIGRAVRDV
jgi:hypothetical protein